MNRFFAVVALLPTLALAQIPVHINSGNPAAPFPQFSTYVNPTDTLYNLATKNPAGVSHAEMEKSIREAYQIMMNRAGKPGGGVGGIDYIKYASNPQCSEGDGYGLLAAASMVDKETFDGLWLYIHDFTMNKIKRYSDCKDASPGYLYSQLPGWTGSGANSAADGDFDIALALLYAYKQWGEFMGVNDGCGNPISYKQAAIDFIRALTDTLTFANSGTGLLSGDIGLDGYVKSGDSWPELSGWAGDTLVSRLPKPAQNPGPKQQYFDYYAPAYFLQFADFLTSVDSAKYSWNIHQFRRAAASSDWLMGQLYGADPRNIPYAGQVSISPNNSVSFSNLQASEDMRLPWRTILNRVWNGNPVSTWDPVAHQALANTPNTFEQDIGRRYARFLWDTRQAPWGNGCVKPVSTLGAYWGPSVLWTEWNVNGSNGNFFFLNWIQGTGSPSAVVAQDFNLMAEMYRQCEIEFDVEKSGDGYLTSVPMYFNDWFRLLGMLFLSGNHPPPSQIKPIANLKVYCDVDKTCAYKGENVTYTISYRNYGSSDANGVVIVASLPAGLSYLSSTAGGSYNSASRTVTWNVTTLPGFTSAGGIAPTTGQFTFTASVDGDASGQLAPRATIRCSNGTGWQTNEYPNTVSAVLKRNMIDIINQPLNDTQKVRDLSGLHGGRPGVHFSFSSGGAASSTMQTITFRLFNDAQEPYIDYGNYRVSYFLYDTAHTCLYGKGCEPAWQIQYTIVEGIDKANLTVRHEMLTPGTDARGKWNQRIIIQLSNPADSARVENFTTINRMLEYYRGMRARVHRGGIDPLRIVLFINSSSWLAANWSDDWSYNANRSAKDAAQYFPITPDFTNPDPTNPGVAVDRLNPKHCETTDTTVDNILVEEWDGYVWRKVFGNAPQIPVGATSHLRTTINDRTTIKPVGPGILRFTLARSGPVRLQVLDMRGRVLSVPINSTLKPGTHTVKWAAKHTGTGIYILRFSAGSEERIMHTTNLR